MWGKHLSLFQSSLKSWRTAIRLLTIGKEGREPNIASTTAEPPAVDPSAPTPAESVAIAAVGESLSERLNRLAKQKIQKIEAESVVRLTHEDDSTFLYENARPEFDRLLALIEASVALVNIDLQDLPPFEFKRDGPYIRQGDMAASLTFSQVYTSTGAITLELAFGREPENVYMDFVAGPPKIKRYRLSPAVRTDPTRIVWSGDLDNMTSEEVADFTLEHLTEYFLALAHR
jgi:hypothetical protein